MDLQTPAEQVKHKQPPNQPVQKQGRPPSQLVDAILTPQNVLARVRVTAGGAPATDHDSASVRPVRKEGKHVESCSNQAAAVVAVALPRALGAARPAYNAITRVEMPSYLRPCLVPGAAVGCLDFLLRCFPGHHGRIHAFMGLSAKPIETSAQKCKQNPITTETSVPIISINREPISVQSCPAALNKIPCTWPPPCRTSLVTSQALGCEAHRWICKLLFRVSVNTNRLIIRRSNFFITSR